MKTPTQLKEALLARGFRRKTLTNQAGLIAAIFEEMTQNTRPEEITICHQAIKHFGRDSQIHKIQEESLELALAINNLGCPTKNQSETVANLYDELADVSIMLTQARILFDAERIDQRKTEKLKRLKKYF